MLRQITTHQSPHAPSTLNVHVVTDEQGKGNSDYLLTGLGQMRGLPADTLCLSDAGYLIRIPFQQGTTKDVGVNGASTEALIAIVKDRLEGFQKGPFPCIWNGIALEYLEKALDALHARTESRIIREVEGDYVA